MTIISKLINPGARPRPTRKTGFQPYDAVAEMAGNLRQYQDMPLQIQREWLAIFLAVVAIFGFVAGLYLNVTARAAIAGREIQTLDAEIAANQRVNADLQTQLGVLLSSNVLNQRALAMGFESVSRNEIEYMVVPGYFPSQGVNFVPQPADTDILAMSPEFTESLFDWIGRQLKSAAQPLK